MKQRMKLGIIGAAIILVAVPIVGLVSHPAIRQDLLAALASQGAASSTSAGEVPRLVRQRHQLTCSRTAILILAAHPAGQARTPR